MTHETLNPLGDLDEFFQGMKEGYIGQDVELLGEEFNERFAEGLRNKGKYVDEVMFEAHLVANKMVFDEIEPLFTKLQGFVGMLDIWMRSDISLVREQSLATTKEIDEVTGEIANKVMDFGRRMNLPEDATDEQKKDHENLMDVILQKAKERVDSRWERLGK